MAECHRLMRSGGGDDSNVFQTHITLLKQGKPRFAPDASALMRREGVIVNPGANPPVALVTWSHSVGHACATSIPADK